MRPEKRTRPLPPDGLDRARRDAARRRRTALGSGAGALAAALVLATALGGLGGGGAQSLDLAGDPTATPTASATAEPGPSVTPDASAAPGPTGAPAPSGSPAPGADPTAGGRSAAPAAGDPSPSPVDEPGLPAPGPPSPRTGGAERPAYTEEPESSVSTGCAGHTMEGPGTCSFTYATRGEIGPGQEVEVLHDVCLLTASAEDLLMGFASGQEQDLVVTQGGREVWRFSTTVRYVQGPHDRLLERQRCFTWGLAWSGVDAQGRRVPPGDYVLTHTLLPATLNGEPTEQPWHSNAFDVTVTG